MFLVPFCVADIPLSFQPPHENYAFMSVFGGFQHVKGQEAIAEGDICLYDGRMT